MNAPSYALQQLLQNSALRRFSHGARFRKTLTLLNPQPGEAILDYGTGDGQLLKLLAGRGCRLTGYEPDSRNLPFLRSELAGIGTATDDFGELGLFDKIACLEVMEHVSPDEMRRILDNCSQMLKLGGRFVISVPLEVGPASVAKNLVRLAKGDIQETNATLVNILRAGVFRSIPRLDYGGGYFGHLGFHYRQLATIIRASGWSIERRTFSPFPLLGPLANSQVFYVLVRGSA